MEDCREQLSRGSEAFVLSCSANIVSAGAARTPEMAGLVLYDAPILGISRTDDPLFDRLKDSGVVGPHAISPDEWLPGARSVVSFFLPYSERVRASNRSNYDWPSVEWTHGRIEGHEMVITLARYIIGFFEKRGARAMMPTLDARFGPRFHFERETAVNPPPRYNSRWSERHIAYISGLGTFGLSRGLITRCGMAGRLGSVITDMALEPDSRSYVDIYEYCNRCGICAKHCPVNAISLETGKSHPPCSDFLSAVLEKEGEPYYGCGKCQVGVPCEARIPKRV
ncbi:MAG: 4Fe-4S binding protein [Clostridiales Family XIII bacterium]|jgi:epoxyqueuosine reductase QueG|nr:4Fe-4S binding protein [Clostridiales Family XIII bacterium]